MIRIAPVVFNFVAGCVVAAGVSYLVWRKAAPPKKSLPDYGSLSDWYDCA